MSFRMDKFMPVMLNNMVLNNLVVEKSPTVNYSETFR
jgi:hypothetical protein